MKVLVVGGGGREHAFAWKIAQSERVDRVYAVPGNGGIADVAECCDVPVAADFAELAEFVERERIDLTVVGPEAPLVDGVVDVFQKRGLPIFGPDRRAAQLEGSKAFAKQIMDRCGVPTGRFGVFDRPEDARAYIRDVGAPIVVKADGLAAGKGVFVCGSVEDAIDAVGLIMDRRAFGEAGDSVLIEECLTGEEASFTLVCDGKTALPLASSQDHKPALDGDLGPNTGGMGAYSPAPVVDESLKAQVMESIVAPLMAGMAHEGIVYRGILYIGLMIDESGPKVLEFNCRLGDPEAQVILPRLSSDLVDLIQAAQEGRLESAHVEWRPEPCVCVVLASGGYPAEYDRGCPIHGLESASSRPDVTVFHAATAQVEGGYVTTGGRVLGVTALGPSIAEAVRRAYAAVDGIRFENAHWRRDIAHRALARLAH